MLLAHLRGLLKPDYKHGLVSRGAEKMILRALAAELQAEALNAGAQADASILPIILKDARVESYENMSGRLRKSDRLRRLLFRENMVDKQKSAIDSMVDLFYALEKAQLIRS